VGAKNFGPHTSPLQEECVVTQQRTSKRPFTVRKGVAILGFLTPAILFVTAFTYIPLFIGSQMAFRNWNLNDLREREWVGFANFEAILTSPQWPTILSNTAVWVFGSIIPQFLLGFAIALWLRKKFRFRGLYQALIFFPWAISGFLIAIIFRWMFNAEFGVFNDLLLRANIISDPIPWLAVPETGLLAAIIANIWYGVTFFAIMILAALQSVPEDLLESASLDGAGKTRTLFSIVIPYIRDTLVLTVLLRTIWILNFPDLIYGMTGGGPANLTHTLTTLMVVTTRKGDYGVASALGLIVLAILIVFSAVYLYLLRDRKDAY
jgi:multiple sugar transport system permease protein